MRCLVGLWVAVAVVWSLPDNAVEVGPLSASVDSLSVTVVLALSDLAGAEEMLEKINSRGDPLFGKFLTPAQFYELFGPKHNDVKKVRSHLAKHGLKVAETTPTTLLVTGPVGSIESVFSVSLVQYEVPETEKGPGYTFHAPLSPATLPSDVSPAVTAVVGIDTHYRHRRYSGTRHPRFANAVFHPVNFSKRSSEESEEGYMYSPFGSWTVTDFAHYYNVDPLYRMGIKGDGQTIGIVSYASITNSDVFAYWSAIGLKVDPNRLKTVLIDGGAGPVSPDSVETTLDIEQSGGIAPHAKIILYEAPNSLQGHVDSFARAVHDNDAQTLSLSWGGWEVIANEELFQGYSGYVAAHHAYFVQAALQGQSIFIASGDSGAYLINGEADCFGPYSNPSTCSDTLSVSHPASDPAVTAVGGTTLAFGATMDGVIVSAPHERVWGEDYMISYCSIVEHIDPVTCDIFPVGGGGGVSVIFPRPSYQQHIYNVQQSEANQDFEYGSSSFIDLPSNYTGRNLPDVSFNSDGQTGYEVYINGQMMTGYGGTSFAAPQLNGVAALIAQFTKQKRLGLINYPLYGLIRNGNAYDGDDAPLNRINYGNNWFYHGSPGYNPGAGAGTINVARFARFLNGYFNKDN